MKKYFIYLTALFLLLIKVQGQDFNLSKLQKPTSSELDTTYLGQIEGINYGFMMGNDGVFDKPAIILEGFDPFNETSYQSVYSHWNKSPVIASLYTLGYDIITVDFLDNNCDILINASYIEHIIKVINTKKEGHHKGILAGESMGGIIGRVVLTELERDNYDHQIKTFIALDSPFKGANLPVGLQYMLSDIKKLNHSIVNKAFEENTGYKLQEITKTLNSKAAQQLIRYHIADTSQYYFTEFQAYLAEMGYPTKTRNIALVNGSNAAKKYNFESGDLYFKLSKGWSPILKIEAECYMTSVNDSDQVVSVVRDYNFWHMRKPHKEYIHHFSSSSKCYDNASGGFLNKIDFSTEGIHEFCFVPTSSAIDLRDDLFYAKQGLEYFDTSTISAEDIIKTKASPFDAIYCNAKNSKHAKIYLIPNIEDFIMKEIACLPPDTLKKTNTNPLSRRDSIITKIQKN